MIDFLCSVVTVDNIVGLSCREIWHQSRAAIHTQKVDVHTRLMRKYPDTPQWWFVVALLSSVSLAMIVCEMHKEELQLPWWGILLSVGLSSVLTLPIAVLTATANKVWKQSCPGSQSYSQIKAENSESSTLVGLHLLWTRSFLLMIQET